jgi:flagellar secretion chaperone FliS
MNTGAYQSYRQSTIHSASPVGLIVLMYDAALKSLYQAMDAIEAKDISRRTECLNHALEIVAHLQGSLDMEHGGEAARTLSHFYSFARARILTAGINNSVESVSGLAANVAKLRDAWQQVDMTAMQQ